MIVLGIETSCDETGVALYDTERGLLAHALFSQIDIHVEYGGVVPELASRDHIRKLLPLIDSASTDSLWPLTDTLPLIDFERPTDSLVYQYALPKTEARRPHPDVRGWEPVLGQNRKGLAEDFVDWVRGMRPPGGEYPIDYTPPDLTSRDRPDPTGPDR